VTTGGTDKRGGLGARGGTGEVVRVVERTEQHFQDKQVEPNTKGRGRSLLSPHARFTWVCPREGERERGRAGPERVQHDGVISPGRVCVLVWRNGEKDGRLREMVSVAGMASSFFSNFL
jgi:hypothetical protein